MSEQRVCIECRKSVDTARFSEFCQECDGKLEQRIIDRLEEMAARMKQIKERS